MADYRPTVFLPVTSFPMRGDLPKREPEILARWERMGLWERLRAAPNARGPFVLHDGPPYANGNIHIGHALNKILKDVINRARQMQGYDAHYVPGWDCHGLPIEWRIEEQYRKSGRDKDAVPVLDFRAECRNYAAEWLAVQEGEFRRLGIYGDWAHRYATMDFPSEAAIAGEIGAFVINGALYRGLRPVMWSVVEKTALAEAEIEYHDHTSTTVWVRFPVVSAGDLHGAGVVIWTTTPWTLPGNRAVAYGPELDYVLVEIAGDRLLLARARLDAMLETLGNPAHRVLRDVAAADFYGLVLAHPLRGEGYDFDVPLMPGSFVTDDQGTGFVHIAPGHGEDDFQLGREHAIAVPETVADDGTYYPWVPLFAGVHVYKAADPVCAALKQANALLARGKLVHSYPHSWRSNAPLIYRATPQWFIRMDGPEQIRAQAMAAIDTTQFVPPSSRNRLASMVAGRPDWCISRQRAWGVPIAAFVERATGEVLRDAEVVARIVEIFAAEGADAWYNSPPSRFLGPDYDADKYEQVRDIVDVWFESGSTHAFVLRDRGMKFPADLYLEGTDQHRGWFQSSLLESIGSRGVAPYRAVLTHGMTLDEKGRKQSKSLGNTTAPQKVIDEYGADILRLWVMNSDTSEDQRIGRDILKQQAELYRRLRNTLRWLLGSLAEFSDTEILPYEELPSLERYILHRLSELGARVAEAAQSYDWTGVYPEIHAFCAADLSAFYFDVRKDAIYCDRPDSPSRRAARTVLDALHRCLCAWLAPVLCFTAEEAYTARFGEETSVHLQLFPDNPQWYDQPLAENWGKLREIRSQVLAAIETRRQENTVGASLEATVKLSLPLEQAGWLTAEEWAELCIVSGLEILPGDVPHAAAHRAHGHKCARCWKVLAEVGQAHPDLCFRCADALESGQVGAPAGEAA